MYSILIGSYARGDYNNNSDCDVVLINSSEASVDKDLLPIKKRNW